MPLPLYQVDAFTDRPFAGNPAAVVLLDGPREEPWMQSVAAEMNLSETAFVRPLRGGGDFELRWFTPAAEVELCGHATLATAHILWETGMLAPDQPARFRTIHSGTLTAVRAADDWINMDFPADLPEAADPPAGLLQCLGLAESHVVAVSRSRYDWLVEVVDEFAVLVMDPDFPTLEEFDCRGIAVTSRITDSSEGMSYEGADFISRFFAPRLRIEEDPVTGSAHCVLGPYWSQRLGRRDLIGYQSSRRGGMVRVRVEDQRILLGGQAVTVLRGELTA